MTQVGEGGCIDGRENRYELTAAAYSVGDHCSAAAAYTFYCRNDATVAFDYEVMAPNGNDGERASFRTTCRCVSLAVLRC